MADSAPALDVERIWAWLEEVPDPEIPVVSVVDLGIVRAVELAADGACVVTITPTYSGCPAMAVIAASVGAGLRARGVAELRVVSQLSPAWTTDSMSESGKRKLRDYGIAAPLPRVADIVDISGLHAGVRRGAPAPQVACPLCGDPHTRLVSQFGSTPCKALYQCQACREPFEYFKCH
ncbi:MAG: 1,2-phenylacetyl-CoA epoxidase subunit PaaD [Pseudomonadota bacterium]